VIPNDQKLLKSKESKPNQLENKHEIKLSKYVLSKDSTAEEKAKVLPFIENIVPIDDNIETHLNKTNANNTNGITHEMEKMVQMKHQLNCYLNEAKQNRDKLKNKMEQISQLINLMESLILQEINFDRVCNLYEDMTQNKFTDKPKSVIKFKSENDEQIYSVEELNDSLQFLDRKHRFRSDEHKFVESKIAVIEQKLNVLVLNLIKLYKYGANKKLIERTDELEFAAEKFEFEIKSKKEQTSRHLDSQSIYNTFTNFFRPSDKTRKDSSVSKV
jgi:hypothetical protein